MEIEINQILSSLISIMVPIAILIASVAYFMSVKSKLRQSNEIDKYRSDIEKKVYQLQDELSSNRERFEQVNHLLLESQKTNTINYQEVSKLQDLSFFKNLDIDTDIVVNKKLIFVLTPFNEKYDKTYEVIKKTCNRAGFECRRGDEERVSGQILRHIMNEILRARIVIANISGRNPNVMYELGICQVIGKPVLLISESAFEIPFDISISRILIYKNTIRLSRELSDWITQTVIENE